MNSNQPKSAGCRQGWKGVLKWFSLKSFGEHQFWFRTSELSQFNWLATLKFNAWTGLDWEKSSKANNETLIMRTSPDRSWHETHVSWVIIQCPIRIAWFWKAPKLDQDCRWIVAIVALVFQASRIKTITSRFSSLKLNFLTFLNIKCLLATINFVSGRSLSLTDLGLASLVTSSYWLLILHRKIHS